MKAVDSNHILYNVYIHNPPVPGKSRRPLFILNFHVYVQYCTLNNVLVQMYTVHDNMNKFIYMLTFKRMYYV